MGKQRITLEHHVDWPLIGWQPHQVLSLEQDLARGRGLETAQHTQQGRFAAARRTQQRKYFTLIYLQRHAIHGHCLVELLDQGNDLQKRDGHC